MAARPFATGADKIVFGTRETATVARYTESVADRGIMLAKALYWREGKKMRHHDNLVPFPEKNYTPQAVHFLSVGGSFRDLVG